MNNRNVLIVLIMGFILLIFTGLGYAFQLDAKVLNLNTRHNFIVLDIGHSDNLIRGQKIDIYKNGVFLGSAEVLRTKENIAALDTTDLRKTVPIAPQDILSINIEATEERVITGRRQVVRREEPAPRRIYQDREIESRDFIPDRRRLYEQDSAIEIYRHPDAYSPPVEEERAPLLVRPFRKIKDWSVSAGRGVKSWFDAEDKIETSFDPEQKRYDKDIAKELVGPATVNLRTQINASRRKVLFLINEELKNRGFIITNYSLIEGIISAQKPIKRPSFFREIFSNVAATIDHKVIYYVEAIKISENQTLVNMDIYTSYKKRDEYILMNLDSDSEVVQEAQQILSKVRQKMVYVR